MANRVPEPAAGVPTPAVPGQAFQVVLKPLSHPELDEIRIEDNLFAIGRTEAPFAAYDAALVADLSRRHARIFSEFGAVYIADLGSKNGTTVNGVNVRQKPCRLNDGDEICLARALCFRVQLVKRALPLPAAKLLSLTLTPDRADVGLAPIVITRFPFLVSKTDEVFARYKEQFPHQVNYISRRHAHVFLKNGLPFVEDLGSTNGTFVNGKRLDEHAVALADDDLVAFGGHLLAYRVSLQREIPSEPTATRLSLVETGPASAAGEADKTTFLAAADSFLDIFCLDQAAPQEEEINREVAPPAGEESGRGGKRHKFRVFLAELREAFAGSESRGVRRSGRWRAALAAGVAAGLAIFALWHFLGGSAEREVQALIERGEYAQAAQLAGQTLASQPDSAELKAMGKEALLKGSLPDWLAGIKAGNFRQAAAAVAAMNELAANNPDARPLVREIEWVGALEQFFAGRGKGEAPIQVYADEETIAAFLKQWDDDPAGHQRAFNAIAAEVPAFREAYAEALSHLRKLQSDDSSYLAAIERLKTAVVASLNRDEPQALEAVLKEYSEKYPRLGLDSLRGDLRQYLEIENRLRERQLGPLVAQLAGAHFATPPFQEKFRALNASGRLPPAEVVTQYQAVAQAWRDGDSRQALAGLQAMSTGTWGEAASVEAKRKEAIAEQFAALQEARASKNYDERLLAFYGALDPAEDVYFIRAIEADLGKIEDQALQKAQDLLARARSRWGQYRDNGPIDGTQRLDTAISRQFRAQARLLSEASEAAQQGTRLYARLKVDIPEAEQALRDEIEAEAETQRNALLELRDVLAPGVLKAKLALIGGSRGDE